MSKFALLIVRSGMVIAGQCFMSMVLLALGGGVDGFYLPLIVLFLGAIFGLILAERYIIKE